MRPIYISSEPDGAFTTVDAPFNLVVASSIAGRTISMMDVNLRITERGMPLFDGIGWATGGYEGIAKEELVITLNVECVRRENGNSKSQAVLGYYLRAFRTLVTTVISYDRRSLDEHGLDVRYFSPIYRVLLLAKLIFLE